VFNQSQGLGWGRGSGGVVVDPGWGNKKVAQGTSYPSRDGGEGGEKAGHMPTGVTYVTEKLSFLVKGTLTHLALRVIRGGAGKGGNDLLYSSLSGPYSKMHCHVWMSTAVLPFFSCAVFKKYGRANVMIVVLRLFIRSVFCFRFREHSQVLLSFLYFIQKIWWYNFIVCCIPLYRFHVYTLVSWVLPVFSCTSFKKHFSHIWMRHATYVNRSLCDYICSQVLFFCVLHPKQTKTLPVNDYRTSHISYLYDCSWVMSRT